MNIENQTPASNSEKAVVMVTPEASRVGIPGDTLTDGDEGLRISSLSVPFIAGFRRLDANAEVLSQNCVTKRSSVDLLSEVRLQKISHRRKTRGRLERSSPFSASRPSRSAFCPAKPSTPCSFGGEKLNSHCCNTPKQPQKRQRLSPPAPPRGLCACQEPMPFAAPNRVPENLLLPFF